MRFLIDAQLPPALARALADAGHESDHVQDLGLGGASDSAIWAHAVAAGSIIITKDDDFVWRASAGTSDPVVVWVRIGNASRKRVLAAILPLLAEIEAAIRRGERVIEIAP